MPSLPFEIVDVFTDRRFGGNPLAVVLDADPLSTAEMQKVAAEFHFSETAFVLRPENPSHDARLRIFTPVAEVPFAGHPNVGAAFVLAARAGPGGPDRYVFEEIAGRVEVAVVRDGGRLVATRVTAPEPLTLGRVFAPADVAAALALDAADVRTAVHPPRIASVGLPFLVVEIATRAALARARPVIDAVARLLPVEGADAIYLYTRERDGRDDGADLSARMFAPFDGVAEDPATGSASAAVAALLAGRAGPGGHRFTFAQGVDMGRPSRLDLEVDVDAAGRHVVRVGGACVKVAAGTLDV